MANYNLETETTVHVKGMSFGGPSGGESSMGGGNSLVISDKNSRVGYYHLTDSITLKIIDSDAMFALEGESEFSSIQLLLTLVDFLKKTGADVSGYIEQLGYDGLSLEFFDMFIDSMNREYVSMKDVVSVTNYNEWDNPVSTGLLPYYVSFIMILEAGDPRPFDEIVTEVSAEMESKIDWSSQLSGTTFHFIIPHVNGDGLINLLRAVANSAQSASYSARPMNLFRR